MKWRRIAFEFMDDSLLFYLAVNDAGKRDWEQVLTLLRRRASAVSFEAGGTGQSVPADADTLLRLLDEDVAPELHFQFGRNAFDWCIWSKDRIEFQVRSDIDAEPAVLDLLAFMTLLTEVTGKTVELNAEGAITIGLITPGSDRITLEPSVYRARSRETKELAATLARAFQGDPIASHLFPEEQGRLALLDSIFRLYLRRVFFGRGHVYQHDPESGGALWLPPGGHPLPVMKQLQLLPGLALIAGRKRLPALLRVMREIEDLHPPSPPHWYLGFLGVDPAFQGMGLGSDLLAPILARCDAEATPAYLETGNPANLPFYARHGFRVIAERELTDGPPIWGLWRDAAKP